MFGYNNDSKLNIGKDGFGFFLDLSYFKSSFVGG